MPDTESGAALLEGGRTLRPRIIAERDRIEAARRIPEDLAQELARAGFFRLLLPEAYGGLDLTPMAALEGFEELGGAGASEGGGRGWGRGGAGAAGRRGWCGGRNPPHPPAPPPPRAPPPPPPPPRPSGG